MIVWGSVTLTAEQMEALLSADDADEDVLGAARHRVAKAAERTRQLELEMSLAMWTAQNGGGA